MLNVVTMIVVATSIPQDGTTNPSKKLSHRQGAMTFNKMTLCRMTLYSKQDCFRLVHYTMFTKVNLKEPPSLIACIEIQE